MLKAKGREKIVNRKTNFFNKNWFCPCFFGISSRVLFYAFEAILKFMNKIYLIEDSRHPASCTLLAVAKIKSNNRQTTSTKNRQKINSKIEFFDEIFHIYVKILWIEKKIIFFFTKMLYMIKLIAIYSHIHFCGKKKWLAGL